MKWGSDFFLLYIYIGNQLCKQDLSLPLICSVTPVIYPSSTCTSICLGLFSPSLLYLPFPSFSDVILNLLVSFVVLSILPYIF